MSRDQDQWATITEAELRAVVPEPPVEVEEPTPQQAARAEAKRVWANNGFRPYPTDAWGYFNRLIHEDQTTSIDFAAAAAGLTVYEALVGLQQRDPYFYEIAVMRGPQGGYVPRRPGTLYHDTVRGVVGAELHGRGYSVEVEAEALVREQVRADQPGKPSIEECRARFLALLGDHSQYERVDGLVDQQVKAGTAGEANVEQVKSTNRERMRGHHRRRKGEHNG